MPTHTTVSNSDDVIDSRDVIARIEELASLREDAKTEATEKQTRLDELEAQPSRSDAEQDEADDLRDYITENSVETPEGVFWGAGYGQEEHDELTALEALQDKASSSPDWTYGETLIRDSYFERWCQEFAEDIGAINKDASWPNTCIDWSEAARQLQQDYTQVDFDGVEYWIRA